MLHPLQQRIAAFRNRIRRLVILYALSWVGGGVVATVVVLGLADYVFRFQDPGLRLMASLSWLGVLGWTGYRFMYRGLTACLSDVDLARRLQRQFPQLGDSLASAVEFLGQSEEDPTAGPRPCVGPSWGKARRLPEGSTFGPRCGLGPVWRAAGIAGTCILVAGVLVGLDPSGSGTALARLVSPFGETAWPQIHHLEIRRPVPQRVNRGGTFRVAVVDAPGVQFPAEVLIYYQFGNPDGPAVETQKWTWWAG